MKKLRLAMFIVFVLGISGGVLFTIYKLTSSKSAAQDANIMSCSQTRESLQVVIVHNQVKPVNTSGKLCDSLTITNDDDQLREIAFGPHEHHVAYDGVVEKFIDQHQSVTITLNQLGSFSFHDHIDDSVRGYFSVTQ